MFSPPSSAVCRLSLGNYSLEVRRRTQSVRPPRIAFISSHEFSASGNGLVQRFGLHLEELLSLEHLDLHHVVVGSSREELRQQIERAGVLDGGFTHVITRGWWQTNQVRELRVLTDSQVEHLYCIPGISDDVSLDSIAEPGWSKMSGVYSRPLSYDRYVRALQAVSSRPIETVCIAYDPCKTVYGLDHFMTEQREHLQKELERAGIEVILHHWTPDAMRADDLAHKATKVDAIITLRDEAVYVHQRTLVELCQQHNILFCSSELDSVACGAAIGCGNAGGDYARPLAYQLAAGWLADRSLHLVEPYELTEEPVIRFNPYTIIMQGVQLNLKEQALLEMRSIFDERAVMP